MQPLPRYFCISQEIIARIGRGELLPGAPVPSENELIREYAVSNTTARKVLAELEGAGWVRRVKGRGTYVQRDRVTRSADRILGFTKNMLEAGRVPSTKLLGVRRLKRSRSLVVNGRSYVLAGPLYEISRLRLADGLPVMKETRYVSTRFCPDLDKKNLESSLYSMYEKDYGLRLARVDQILSAVLLRGEELASFGLKKAIPAFRVEGATFCGKDLILELEESLYRGDLYRFFVRAIP